MNSESKTARMMQQSIIEQSKSDSNGLGFLVENLLNERESNERESYYDDIKKNILGICTKIKERKNYNHKYNKTDANDATTSYMNYSKVREQYRELLKLLYAETENNETKHRAKWHIVMLYRLFAFTRDISEGCGERDLAYMQLFELARMDVVAASHALKTAVSMQPPTQSSNRETTKPLGSWKDVKGLVAHMRKTMNMRDERDMAAYLGLTKCAVNLVNERLAKDVLSFYKDNDEDNEDNEDNGSGDCNRGKYDDEVSLVSKWIPRENKSKKYGNFYERLACDYYKDWIPKDRNANPVSYEKAVVKCKIHYRKLVSFLNQYLETPQINMCRQQWSDITFSKTTHLTRCLQDRALLNLKSDDRCANRHAGNADRVACAEKYKVWKCDTINYNNGIKTDLTTHVAVSKYYTSCNAMGVNRNAEWAAFASQDALKSRVKRIIPVLAGSCNKAIGLALAVAENAATGRTLIVKDGEELVLHDLDASFVKNVKYLTNKAPQWRHRHHGLQPHSAHNHPMYKCLISALKLLVESNVAAKETRDTTRQSDAVGAAAKETETPPGFTVTIFADDDSSAFFNDDVSFGEVWNEASLLYREFGYGVPNVVVWAMSSNSNNSNNNNNSNNSNNNGEEAYSSVSYGGNLTIRVGCDASDICTYLGIKNVKEEQNDKKNKNNQSQHIGGGWKNEWNRLVELLYDGRYYNFGKYFFQK